MRLLENDIAQLLVAAGATPSVAAAWAPHALVALEVGETNTPLRIGHFLAQIAHESDRFRTTEEYASGAAYEGRRDLGNIYAGDGKRYKGRGLIQLTGRYNYTEFQAWLVEQGYDVDVVENPTLVAKMPWAMLATIFYWNYAPKSNGLRIDLDASADKGDTVEDVKRITRLINGGYNGLAHRLAVFRAVMAEIRRMDGYRGDRERVLFGPPPRRRVEPATPRPTVTLAPEPQTEGFWQRFIKLTKRFIPFGGNS